MASHTERRVDELIKDPSRVKPEFITNPNMDKLIAVVLRLAMENSVLTDRLVRQEALLIKNNILSADDYETYVPSKEVVGQSQAQSFDLIRAIAKDLG